MTSTLGPARAQLQATPQGREAAERWLRQPAAHARDIRSELLVKVALLDALLATVPAQRASLPG
jgi:PadR family transcriptional regulator AphA